MNECDFDDLITSVKQAGQIMRNEIEPGRRFVVSALDIKAIREKTHKSQAEFARMIGISRDTLQNWEQGRRNPRGPARALLKLVDTDPDLVAKVLS